MSKCNVHVTQLISQGIVQHTMVFHSHQLMLGIIIYSIKSIIAQRILSSDYGIQELYLLVS